MLEQPMREQAAIGFIPPNNEVSTVREAPGAAEIRGELTHVLQSAPFRNAHQLSLFLSFVVESALAGHSDRIKSYTIAVDALGRTANFDPQTDPIVRVAAGRLRRALADYYAGVGGVDTVEISIPRGNYVPQFRWRVSAVAVARTAAVV